MVCLARHTSGTDLSENFRRAVYIRRIDDMPGLSDVGRSSNYDYHNIRCGQFPPMYPYLHISSCSHTLLLQSYTNVPNKSSLTTKISYIYHFPRETPTFTILYKRTLSIYRNTSVLLKSNAQLPVSPCHRQTPPLVTRQSPAPTLCRF